ncbi:hypothetical protein ACFWN1_14710 [Streptomyces sp. NPDC058459]|uniref:hypothetical protein n=1 Tax=Streptomyces sp. NPDC058459 TaxID=3346508 RepID=UPI00366A18B0
MTAIRKDVADLLTAGHSDAYVARQLGVDPTATVAPARRALRLPKIKPGPKAAAAPEDLFWERVKRIDDGHMKWTGYRGKTGAPGLRYNGCFYTAARVAFRIAQGRDPEGYTLPVCGHDGCVAPDHQADRIIRAEARKIDALYASIFPSGPR